MLSPVEAVSNLAATAEQNSSFYLILINLSLKIESWFGF